MGAAVILQYSDRAIILTLEEQCTDLKHRLGIIVHRQDVGDAILGQAFSVF